MSGKHKFASPNANKVKEKKKQWETISTEEWNTVLQNECDLPYIQHGALKISRPNNEEMNL